MSTSGISRRRPIQALAAALLIAVGVLMPTTATHATAAEARTITVLQLNLCNGGGAPCFEEKNKDRSVGEAIDEIMKMEPKPDVITLNEVCQKDVFTITRATGYQENSHIFFPAFWRNDDGSVSEKPFKCTGTGRDGYQNEDYGIGFMVRDHGHAMRPLGVRYAEQDTTSREVRVAVCAEYRGLNVCTTHLVVAAKDKALAQCMTLRRIAAEYARQQPTVVAGDFNLKYDDSTTNVQKCVPEGFFRKGDGNVQHVMASAQFDFVSSRTIELKYTDHDGLMVALRLR